MENSVDLDEVAHYEPPHQDLLCLQIQLFSSLVVNCVRHCYGYMTVYQTVEAVNESSSKE